MPFPDYPIPADEEQRLRDLQRYALLDTPADPHLDRLVRLASAVLNMPIALVSLVDQDRQWFLARHGLDVAETPRRVAFCAHTIAGDTILVVPDASQDPRFMGNPLVQQAPQIRFYAGAPLKTPKGHNLGTLCVIDKRPRNFEPEQVQLLELMADLVMRELQLRQLSMKCPVTGLYTRRAFFQFGEQEVACAKRDQRPLSLFNFDIDDFRQINNRWGHKAGDQVLLDVCQAARSHLSSDDLFGRIGDEEFSILLVDTDLARALLVAEQVREQIAQLRGVFDHSDYQPRISGGITRLSNADRSFNDLFYRADQALYLAKGNGRNQIASLVAD